MITRIRHRSNLAYTRYTYSKANRSQCTSTRPEASFFNFPKSRRGLATVASETIIGPPPKSPTDSVIEFDRHLLSVLHQTTKNNGQKCLQDLVQDYFANSGRILEKSLKYESRPGSERKLQFENGDGSSSLGAGGNDGIVMVAHCFRAKGREETFGVVSCSGFVIDVYGGLVVTCAHTLEQIRRSPLLENESDAISGSFVIAPSADDSVGGFDIRSVTAVPSCLPRSDVLLLSPSPSPQPLKSLPVSPYPLQPGKPVRAHLISETKTIDDKEWTPWIGGTHRTWAKGVVKGYRDWAGREAEPGTYDSLNHILFTPIPTAGSSGGPIVDEESGAVVGIILGSRMDNRVEGLRGWGVPGEVIFEMFSLPGLEGKR